jgi:serine/threonine-protein kinase RsbT
LLEIVEDRGRRGLRLTFADEGPGIADKDRAMQDGFTTGSGLGLGLGGAKRLSNDFSIESAAGAGTRVTIVRWKG